MAVLTAQGISRVAIELLTRQLSLPRTATMVPGEEFSGPNGATITVRVPQPRSALTQNTPGGSLTPEAASEVGVDVSLAHIYNLHNLTDQEQSLQLEDFARQITLPQVEAIATGAEDAIVTKFNALTVDATIEFASTASDDDTIGVLLAAREFLSENDAPPANRYFAAAPDIITRILSVEQFTRVNESGGSDALRNAIVGRLYGMTIVECNGLTDGTAVAYHRSGVAFATRVPMNPRGATASAGTVAQGIGLRQVFQYNAANAQDQSLVSTFVGAAMVYDDESGTDNQRFVKIGTST